MTIDKTMELKECDMRMDKCVTETELISRDAVKDSIVTIDRKLNTPVVACGCTYCEAGPAEQGRMGRLQQLHFFGQFYVILLYKSYVIRLVFSHLPLITAPLEKFVPPALRGEWKHYHQIFNWNAMNLHLTDLYLSICHKINHVTIDWIEGSYLDAWLMT